MRILAIERELSTAPTITMEQILRVEAACVWDLQKRGIIREMWFTSTGNHVVIMLECASATEARQHLEMLPLVHAGVIDFTVHELRSYDGFERLFAHLLRGDVDATTRKRGMKSHWAKEARGSPGCGQNPAGSSSGGGHSRAPSPRAFLKR